MRLFACASNGAIDMLHVVLSVCFCWVTYVGRAQSVMPMHRGPFWVKRVPDDRVRRLVMVQGA